jgi:hypothetical protein
MFRAYHKERGQKAITLTGLVIVIAIKWLRLLVKKTQLPWH